MINTLLTYFTCTYSHARAARR